MRCDEYVDGIRPISAIGQIKGKIARGELIGACPIGGKRPVSEEESKSRMATGCYVPDEEHVHVCLNCKKKTCRGSCALVRGRGKKHKAKEGQ